MGNPTQKKTQEDVKCCTTTEYTADPVTHYTGLEQQAVTLYGCQISCLVLWEDLQQAVALYG